MRRMVFFLCLFCFPAMLPAEPSTEVFIAGYHVEARALILADSLEAAEGTLKPFALMTPREIATIYHELWHAYFIECETPSKPGAPGGKIHEAFRARMDSLYPDAPPEKRMEIQEEAAADFIDAVIETYVQMKRFLASKTPEQREAVRKESRYLRVYGRLFEEKYRGYYTKTVRFAAEHKNTEKTPPKDAGDSPAPAPTPLPPGTASALLSDFIRDARAFGLPTGYLESAAEKLQGVFFIKTKDRVEGPGAEVVWAAASLGPADLAIVERVLFEGILTRDPLEVFAETRF